MAPTTHQPSPERIVDVGRGFQLCVQSFGDESAPAVLLIAGLGQQLLSWPDDLCSAIADAGHHVIRFDNRDVGRSTRATNRPPGPRELVRRRISDEQYTLGSMAKDTSLLLTALGVESAHVVGVSMGGMIGQTLAARNPEQVRSLVSIMSSTGSSRSGLPARSTWLRMARPPGRTRDASIKSTVSLFRHIGSHGFPFDEAEVRSVAGAAYDRGHSPAGVRRQLGAIMKSGSRTHEVRTITAPTLVIHGDRDLMVDPSGGAATHAAISGSRLETIVGLGHDLPAGVRPRLATLIVDHARAADAGRAAGNSSAAPAAATPSETAGA